MGIFGGCGGAGGDLAVGQEGKEKPLEEGQSTGCVWKSELDSASGKNSFRPKALLSTLYMVYRRVNADHVVHIDWPQFFRVGSCLFSLQLCRTTAGFYLVG